MNLSYIDWYLVEMGRELNGLMPDERREALLFETKNHLMAIVEELTDEGQQQTEAEKTAIERFGDPRTIARQFVRTGHDSQGTFARVARGSLVSMMTLFLVLGAIAVPFVPQYVFGWLIVASFALFGIYARLTGLMPKVTTFLIPAAVIAGLALPTAGFFSYYQSSNGSPILLPRNQLHAMAADAASRDRKAIAFEDHIISQWKQILSDPKFANGIPDGSSLLIPALREGGGNGIFVLMPMEPGKTFHKVDGNEQILLGGPNVRLSVPVARADDVIKGPVSRAKFESQMKEQIAQTGWQRNFRGQAVGILESAADRPFIECYGFFTLPLLAMYLLGGVPVGLLASLLGSAMHRYFRLRRRKLRLA
ncbi:MAG: hypothetical protein JST12_02080 [Armatimonadetes bacterium]|nr:hypothetical protein [Armatimonadota bacterium]